MAVYTGIILKKPHGALLALGEKKLIIKSKKFTKHIGEELVVLQGRKAYAIIRLKEPYEIDLERFKDLRDRHRISEKERKRDWPGKRKLYAYEFDLIRAFWEPIKPESKIPLGPQVFVKNVEVDLRKVKEKEKEKVEEKKAKRLAVKYFERQIGRRIVKDLENLNQMDVVMIAGIPGAGKTEVACTVFKDRIYIGKDIIRTMLEEMRTCGEAEWYIWRKELEPIVDEIEKIVFKHHLFIGDPVVVEETLETVRERLPYIKMARKYGRSVGILFIDRDLDSAIKRNKERKWPVPERVIKEKYMMKQYPIFEEGFKVVLIERPEELEKAIGRIENWVEHFKGLRS